jgi:hypothetical protein
MAMVVLAALAWLGPVSAVHAVGPLDLVVPGLPSPNDVVRLIDSLTRVDSTTSVDVKLGSTVGQGKLLIARTRVDVVMERSSRNWRGQVVVHLTVPSDVSYSVDLSEIRPEHIRLDTKERLLIIAMPTPKVEDVTPVLSGVKTDNKFKRARFKFMDRETSHELQNVMLKEDYLARARKAAEERAGEIRQKGRGVLEAFLRRLLAGPCPGVKVVVEESQAPVKPEPAASAPPVDLPPSQ